MRLETERLILRRFTEADERLSELLDRQQAATLTMAQQPELAGLMHLCQAGLLATEQRAREGGLGLWREERYRPVAASDFDRLDSLVGRFAVVEGRIRSVGERH